MMMIEGDFLVDVGSLVCNENIVFLVILIYESFGGG